MMPRYSGLLVALLCASALLEAYVNGVPLVHAARSGSNRQADRTPSSDFIKSLQRELKRAGYDPGVPDGKMGPSTRQALRQFQKAHGLSPTGNPDIPTLTKLLGQGLPQ
jgi:peptidoglycan hydrolase-like protein with peptidoglycan-binding domain